MNFNQNQVVERVSALPVMRQAAQAGAQLLELWPLTDALKLDNDVRYGENLQVRITQAMACALTGEEVTTADAEFVYEGAEEIPGRPQNIVDALLAANDAYDAMSSYSDTHDTSDIIESAQILNISWDEHVQERIATVIDHAQTYVEHVSADQADLLNESSERSISWKFAVVIVLLDKLLRIVSNDCREQLGQQQPHIGGAPDVLNKAIERAALPIALFINEFAEQMQIPKLCATGEQTIGVLRAYDTPNNDDDIADAAVVLAQAIVPIAVKEWRKHREDIEFDPVKAKKLAREEDERKNKEALAAKFAHVEEDTSKPPVEL